MERDPPLNEAEKLFVLVVNAAEQARREGDRAEALDKFGTAAQVLAEAGRGAIRPSLEAGFLSQFGILLMSENELESALTMQERALWLDEQHGSAVDIALSRHNLAGVLRELGRTDEAVAQFKLALAAMEAEGLEAEVDNVRGELATTLIEADRLDEAEPYL